MGYKSHAQRKAVHAHRADGGKGHPDKKGSPAKMENDSIASVEAWKQFRKGYMDRTEKMGKPITAEENQAEYDREKNEFYYDPNSKKIRLIPTDDGEVQDRSGIEKWQLAPSMRSPIERERPERRKSKQYTLGVDPRTGERNTGPKDRKVDKTAKHFNYRGGKSIDELAKAAAERKAAREKKSPLQMVGVQSPLNKISGPCKAAAKKKFKVWPSAYASGWGVRCTKAGGPSNYGGGKKK